MAQLLKYDVRHKFSSQIRINCTSNKMIDVTRSCYQLNQSSSQGCSGKIMWSSHQTKYITNKPYLMKDSCDMQLMNDWEQDLYDMQSNSQSGNVQTRPNCKIRSATKITYASWPLKPFRQRAFQPPTVVGFPVSDSPFLIHTKTMSSENQDQDTNQ